MEPTNGEGQFTAEDAEDAEADESKGTSGPAGNLGCLLIALFCLLRVLCGQLPPSPIRSAGTYRSRAEAAELGKTRGRWSGLPSNS